MRGRTDSQAKTKNDAAWEQIFDQYSIVAEIERYGRYEIEASQINPYRESRLMAKLDHRSALPRVFQQHDLSILPLSRSRYCIGHMEAYQDIVYEEQVPIVQVPWPATVESIDCEHLYSEASALLCAYNSGMIADLLGEEVRYTLGGRMSTGAFSFTIDHLNQTGSSYELRVDNSQCEIDAGFESRNHLLLLEAKNFSVEDLLVRQLYFPYRLWQEKIGKAVLPIFMTFSNDLFTFFVFDFEQSHHYNSLRLLRQKRYKIAPGHISMADLADLYAGIRLVEEPADVPFPQADSFPRLIDLLGLLYAADVTKEELTDNYNFTARQTDYYTNAARYLRLVDKTVDEEIGFRLSEPGRSILKKPYKAKYLAFIQSILEHEVFYKAFRTVWETRRLPDKERIAEVMGQCRVYGVSSEETRQRRAQTIRAWLKWILTQTEEYTSVLRVEQTSLFD